MKSAIAVIPARYGSTRFPGKPLADRTGRPLIQHVVERALEAQRVGRVIVATDDRRIMAAVQRFGGEAMMTREDHPNGTSRIAEVVQRIGDETTADGVVESRKSESRKSRADSPGSTSSASVIVNVQGDEPEIEPHVIDELVDGLLADPDAPMATLASAFMPDEDPADPNIVKLVVDQRGRALYFSRSLIPFDRDGRGVTPLKHPGLYAYRPDFLLEYVRLPPTPLEQIEKLEQLRAVEHGYPIAVVRTTVRHHGIDTPEQYEQFVKRWGERARQ